MTHATGKGCQYGNCTLEASRVFTQRDGTERHVCENDYHILEIMNRRTR